MDNVWFTSDTHFNHAGIFRFRPWFRDLTDMNETMIARWNECVQPGDRVYHLGDFALGDREGATRIFHRLNGQKFLIRGNHEAIGEKLPWVWVKDYHMLKYRGQKIALCHYAFRTWNCSHHGAWNLHGHSHGTLEDLPTYRQMDVGVDCNGFYPVSFDKAALHMSTKTFKPVDHHGDETYETSGQGSESGRTAITTPVRCYYGYARSAGEAQAGER